MLKIDEYNGSSLFDRIIDIIMESLEPISVCWKGDDGCLVCGG
jgi:hypothetical protein